jgi:LacI family transcriptional regulator
MSPRPTIHAVAARAGVSTATVSKVVNRIPSGVSAATRARVEAVIKELGYRPNRLGRSLRTLRNYRIGLAIVDPSPRFLADPFTTNLVAGLANHLNSRGFGLLLHGIQPGQLEASFLVRESEVDALCLSLSGAEQQQQTATRLLSNLGHPVVIFQQRPDPSLTDVCFIRQDDREGARMLACEMMKRQPKRALMIIPDVYWPAVGERVGGIRAVLDPEEVKLDLVECDETRSEAIVAAVEAYLDREEKPDLIIGQNDQIAIAAIHALRGRGLRVPEDVGVAGFNAFPFMDFADPSLATVRSRAYEIGQIGGEIILDRLETGQFREREHVLPLQLVAGRSI